MDIQDQGTAHLKMGGWTRTFTVTGFRECSSLPLAEKDQFFSYMMDMLLISAFK